MAVIVSDSFNRANNANSLGVSETGQAWAALEGTWGINSNQAIVNTEDSVAVIETGVSDCTVIMTAVNLQIDGRGLMLRQASGTAVDGLQLQIESGTLLSIYQRPEWSTIAQVNITPNPPSGTIVKVELKGTSIKVYFNDVLKLDTVSNYNLTATRHGMGSWKAGPIGDDFKIETSETAPILTKNGEFRISGSVLPIYSLTSIPTANQLRTFHPTKGVSCFELVPITDAKASKIRINAKGTIKAIKKE